MEGKFSLLLGTLLILILSSCAKEGIPMIGIDDRGTFLERYSSDRQFRDELRKVSSQVNASIFQALHDSSQDKSGMLRSVIVGLGFNLQAGLGPIVTLGVSPKVRFAFSNSSRPIVP